MKPFEKWSKLVSDNTNRDHIKRLSVCYNDISILFESAVINRPKTSRRVHIKTRSWRTIGKRQGVNY